MQQFSKFNLKSFAKAKQANRGYSI